MSETIQNMPELEKINSNKKTENESLNLNGSFQISAFLTLLRKYTLQEVFYVELYEDRTATTKDITPDFFKISIDKEATFSSVQKQVNELSDTICVLKCTEVRLGQTNGLVRFTDKRESRKRIEFSISIKTEEDVLEYVAAFNTDLLDSLIFSQIQPHYENILNQAISNPNILISDFSLLNKQEEKLILYDWNETSRDYPNEHCLHHLFEQRVLENPTRTAAFFDGRAISYEELNQKANKLSHILIGKELKSDDLVAIYMDLSFDALVAIIAVLKAGGAYLPLHPDNPSDRLRHIVTDAGPKHIICQRKYQRQLESISQKALVIEDLDLNDSNIYAENPVTRTSTEDLAYVIYTSGSTGKPKGVMIQHDNLINNIFLIKDRYNLTSDDVVLSMPNLAFDASVSKLFPILTVGGSVVLPTPEEAKNPESMLRLVDYYKCPYFAATPSFIRVINEMKPDLSALRMVTSGGEALHYQDIDNILITTDVLNVYGPTEATVSSCSYLVKEQEQVKTGEQRIPIGKPNPNCKMYVLDSEMKPLPIGCSGYLYIGGSGVGRGYINNQSDTDKLFVKNPFDENDIIYKTGDIARWLPSGNLDFCGRDDDQVKIRGYRITTDEIEQHLSYHPKIKQHKIVVYADVNQNQSLAAFLEAKPGHKLDKEEIRSFLVKRLPSYMIPSRIALFDQLPLNQSGKIDTQKLKSTLEEPANRRQDVENGSEITTQLLGYVRQLIDNKELASNESIFHGGAHSIHVMQLKLHISNQFKVDIPIKYLFEKPTIEQIATRIKAGLSQGLNQRDSSGSLDNSGSILQSREQPNLPLTPSERRVWFLNQYHSQKAVYNITKSFFIDGELDVSALQKALNMLVERHKNLRKTFQMIDGEPAAQIKKRRLRIDPIEFVQISKDSEKSFVEKFIQREREKPFDLATDIPLRVNLAKIKENRHLLVISLHHIIADGWSFPIFSDELGKLYASQKNNQAPKLEDLGEAYNTYPFIDPDKNHQQHSLKYWLSELKGKLDPINLPYDFQPEERDLNKGSIEKETISQDLFKQIQLLAQQTNTTVFTVLFAALKTLLYIYSRDENIKVAIPVAERNSETGNLIGFFVNTLLINTSFRNDPAFSEVLVDIRNRFPDIQEYADLPFDELVSELRKEHELDVDSLIQIMFTYQNFEESLSLDKLDTKRTDTKNRLAKFDLTITIEQIDGGKVIAAEYRRSKFKEETIRQFLKSYVRLLHDCTRNKNLRTSEINLTDSTTKFSILKDWNNTVTVQADCPIHKLFELQVESSPTANAIAYENHKIHTYKGLNALSNQLAHFLISFNVGKEEPVALIMDESDQSLVCMLAILKAGGAFIPIDVSNPKERIDQMLKETKTQFVITQSHLKHKFSSSRLKTIALDKAEKEIATQSKENPEIGVDPKSLAYIMFTSGTTGVPKAVAIEHRAVCRLVMNTNYLELGRIGPFTRLLKTGAFGFDASTFEVWGMLLNGGCIYLAAKNNLLNPAVFAKKIAEHDINMLWLTTSWFNELVDADPHLFKPVKNLLVGGERLSAEHINKLRAVNDDIALYNMYGPTENTTFSLFFKMGGFQREPIPIGKPVANSTVYILSKSGQLLPPGIPGEICVGGPGLARGYLNDPVQTAEKFVKHPLIDGERLYKTGDLGKWHEDGNIEFLGRLDDQLKLNGFRIETQEIENILSNYPDIKKCAVLLKEKGTLKRLIAFYTSTNGVSIVNEDLRAFLMDKLPTYMIPFDFKPVDKFPLTNNGKLDNGKLLMSIDLNVNSSGHVAPENLMQEQLAILWEEILGITDIGINSNFFDLGGHSLLAVKLMSRIEKEFKKELPVSVLFEAPTIKDLAKVIEHNNGNDSCIVEIQKEGSRPPLFVIPGYLFYYHLSNHLGEDQPVYGFEPVENLTVEEVAAVYINEIKKVQPQGPYQIGGYCAGGIVAYEIAQQLNEAGDQLSFLGLFEVYTPEATRSKMSPQYITEKWNHLKDKVNTASSFTEKLDVIRNESQKAMRLMKLKWSTVTGDAYRIKPYDGELKIFRASDGMIGATDNSYAGWDNYCSKDNLEVFKVPGNHNTIFKEPNVGHIAKDILHCIDRTSMSSV